MAFPPARAQLFLGLFIGDVVRDIKSKMAWRSTEKSCYLVDDNTFHPWVADMVGFFTAMGASLDEAFAPVAILLNNVCLPMLREFVRLGFDINTKLGKDSKTTMMDSAMYCGGDPNKRMEYLLVEMGARVDLKWMGRATPRTQGRIRRVLVGRSVVPLLWLVSGDLVRMLLGYLVEPNQ